MQSKAEWAVRSKNSGDTRDYRVLAWSNGQLGENDYRELFDTLAVGTIPENQRRSVDSPPWVTFGTYKHQKQLFLVVIRQEWTADRDGSSRPIAAQTCMCVPYSDLAKKKVGLPTITKEMPDYGDWWRISAPDREPLSISLATPDGYFDAVAKIVEDLDFDFCAAIASSLLQGPVALVGAGVLELEERISYLNAIISLLPYGIRSCLSVSTWLASAGSHSIRLGFTHMARPNVQQRVEWKQKKSLIVDNLERDAKQYFSTLIELRDRFDLSVIISRLALVDRQYTLADVSALKSILYSLDQAHLVWRSVRRNEGSVTDVQRVFNQGKSQDLSLQQRDKMLGFLIDRISEDTIPTVSTHWSQSLWPHFSSLVLSELKNPEIDRAQLDLYANFASSIGRLCELLNEVIGYTTDLRKTNQLDPPQQKQLFLVVVDMLHRVLSGKKRKLINDCLPSILRPVATNQQLLYQFVKQADLETRRRWLSYLQKQIIPLAEDIVVLQIACGGRRQAASLEMIEKTARIRTHFVSELIKFAADAKAMGNLMPALSLWLLDNLDGLTRSEREFWRRKFTDSRTYDTISLVRDQARFDLLCLAFRTYTPPHFLDHYLRSEAEDIRPYASEFAVRTGSVGIKQEVVNRNYIRYVNSKSDLNRLLDRELDNLHYFTTRLIRQLDPTTNRGIAELQTELRVAAVLRNAESLPEVVDSIAAIILSSGYYIALRPTLRRFAASSYFRNPPEFERFLDMLYTHLIANTTEAVSNSVKAAFVGGALEGQFSNEFADEYKIHLWFTLLRHTHRINLLAPVISQCYQANELAPPKSLLKIAGRNIRDAIRSYDEAAYPRTKYDDRFQTRGSEKPGRRLIDRVSQVLGTANRKKSGLGLAAINLENTLRSRQPPSAVVNSCIGVLESLETQSGIDLILDRFEATAYFASVQQFTTFLEEFFARVRQREYDATADMIEQQFHRSILSAELPSSLIDEYRHYLLQVDLLHHVEQLHFFSTLLVNHYHIQNLKTLLRLLKGNHRRLKPRRSIRIKSSKYKR